MTAWILSIIGIIFTSVICEIIMPEGKTNSFIKSILVIIFMYVVLTPMINLLNNDRVFVLTKLLK